MKIVTNKINNTDEYSIIRYSISELVLKTIILIISYLIYVSLGIFRFKESLSLEIVIKFIIGSLPFFIFLYSEVILAPSKELLLIKENNLILKKYILFFCYYRISFKYNFYFLIFILNFINFVIIFLYFI